MPPTLSQYERNCIEMSCGWRRGGSSKRKLKIPVFFGKRLRSNTGLEFAAKVGFCQFAPTLRMEEAIAANCVSLVGFFRLQGNHVV